MGDTVLRDSKMGESGDTEGQITAQPSFIYTYVWITVAIKLYQYISARAEIRKLHCQAGRR